MGIAVDDNKMQLLEFKSNILKALDSDTMRSPIKDMGSGMGTHETFMNVSEIESRYKDLIESLNAKSITQSEYNSAVAKMKKYEVIVNDIYKKAVALTDLPDETYPSYWVEENYPGTERYINSGNALIDTLPDGAKEKAKKIQDVKSKVNKIQNQYDGLLNTPLLKQIKF